MLSLFLAACGAAPERDTEPDGVDVVAVIEPGAGAALSDDLVMSGESDGDLLEAPGDPGTSGAPKVFYLHYADGRALPRTSPDPCRGAAPKFVCNFAPTLAECQRQIQTYLDKWYADFNVVFTLTRPTSGSFYTEVISSGGGAWCDAAANVAGVAPFLCDDLAGGVAYTFRGGDSAKDTAIIIAQEQAHLVGLEHTLSTRDIMDPTICPNCDGFENVDNRIQNDHCDRSRQNSYQMMKARLGTWTGGIKPTPFGCQADAVVPLVQILAPANAATVGDSFQLRVQASDDCKVSRVTVTVAPMGLQAQSTAPPFEWTLTRITGRQTITVTAVDPAGQQSSASVVVNAPAGSAAGGAAAGPGPGGANDAPGAGCDVGGCDVGGHAGGSPVGWASVALAAAALVILARRRSPARPCRGVHFPHARRRSDHR
ncbi:MAG: Ig-like domain-containing protein [Pseudomonadota bacterium]